VTNEFNIKKIQKFESFLKDAETFVFNTNVFKKAKFAMNDEEVKKEEDKVKELAAYLKDNAVQALIKNF